MEARVESVSVVVSVESQSRRRRRLMRWWRRGLGIFAVMAVEKEVEKERWMELVDGAESVRSASCRVIAGLFLGLGAVEMRFVNHCSLWLLSLLG